MCIRDTSSPYPRAIRESPRTPWRICDLAESSTLRGPLVVLGAPNWALGAGKGCRITPPMASTKDAPTEISSPMTDSVRASQRVRHSCANRTCRLGPAHQGMKIGAPCGKRLGVVGAPTPPLWIPAFAGMTNVAPAFCRTCASREAIFVPIIHPGWGRHTKGLKTGSAS